MTPTWGDTLDLIEQMKQQRPPTIVECLIPNWQIERLHPEMRREMVRMLHHNLGSLARSNGWTPGPMKVIRCDGYVVFQRRSL